MHTSSTIHSPDLTGWSLNNLLGEYVDLSLDGRDALVREQVDRIHAVSADMARIVEEIERRIEEAQR